MLLISQFFLLSFPINPIKSGFSKSYILATTPTDVTVKNAITSFTAKTPKKLEVVFAGELTSVAKENFTLVDANGAKVAIQKATLGDDKKTVTLDLYGELTTATTYTVTAKIGDDTLTESLNFVKGAVAKIVADNQIVKADTLQAVKYTVFDENGLDITDSTAVTFSANVPINLTTGELNIANGALAYVTITYVNPTTGAEIKSNTFTVTGSNSAATAVLGVTVSDTTVTTWPATVTTTVTKNASNAYLYAQYCNQYNDKIVSKNDGNDGVSFESLDPTILVVDAKSGKITALAEGTAQVKVTAGTVSQLFTITVTAPSQASKLAVDASSVLKASKTNSAVNKASVKINVLDQNSKEYKGDVTANNLTFTLTSGANVLNEVSTVGGTKNGTAGTPVEFTAKNPGTATFKVTSAKTSLNYVMVSITVYGTDEVVVKYGLTGIKDLNVQDAFDADSNTNDYKTTVSVNALNKDGFVVESDVVSGAAINVTKPDKTIVPLANGADNFDASTTFNAVGAYTITASKNDVTIATATINVKDTGVKPVVTIKSNSVEYNDVKTNFTSNFSTETGWTIAKVKFVSGNESIIATSKDGTSTLSAGSGTGNVTLYNVVVVVEKNGRTFDVPTNQSITVKNVQ